MLLCVSDTTAEGAKANVTSSSNVFHRIFLHLWRQVMSHIHLHIYHVIASSLSLDEFWKFRFVLLYKMSHTVLQLNAQ